MKKETIRARIGKLSGDEVAVADSTKPSANLSGIMMAPNNRAKQDIYFIQVSNRGINGKVRAEYYKLEALYN